MNIFPQDPKIDIGTDGFDSTDLNGRKFDLLDRKEFGQRLTNLVDRIEQPLVIALDGEWGSGKSHFLKLWAGGHKKELNGKAEVIYFDAFEHDFLDDPLVSLISRLADEAAPKTWGVAAIETLKKSAFPLVKMVSRVGIAVATYGATEMAKPVVDVAIAKVSETTDAAIDQFWKNETNRIKAMQGFRDALTALTIKEDGTTQKIVFIIDELDRCRPDYALNLLEIIKHFFAVPNVHFVLGVNLRELENSVKARYGAGINARKYLQKFVTLEMRLPNKYSYHGAPESCITYLQAIAPSMILYPSLSTALEEAISILAMYRTVTLRDVQRVLTIISIGQQQFPAIPQRGGSHGYATVCVGAALLKVLSPDIYTKLRVGSVSLSELTDALALQFPRPDTPKRSLDRRTIIWGLALEGRGYLEDHGFEPIILDAFKSVFDEFGDPFSWRTAEEYFSRIFDTFALPTP